MEDKENKKNVEDATGCSLMILFACLMGGICGVILQLLS
jgi:hypothetical protein